MFIRLDDLYVLFFFEIRQFLPRLTALFRADEVASKRRDATINQLIATEALLLLSAHVPSLRSWQYACPAVLL